MVRATPIAPESIATVRAVDLRGTETHTGGRGGAQSRLTRWRLARLRRPFRTRVHLIAQTPHDLSATTDVSFAETGAQGGCDRKKARVQLAVAPLALWRELHQLRAQVFRIIDEEHEAFGRELVARLLMKPNAPPPQLVINPVFWPTARILKKNCATSSISSAIASPLPGIARGAFLCRAD
jgi:hypothetical protein